LNATPKSGGDVFFSDAELPGEALYRGSVGQIVAWRGLSGWMSHAASAPKFTEPRRGGGPVMFRVRARGLPRVGPSHLLHPFARLMVEAVDGSVVSDSVVESEYPTPRRTLALRPELPLPPGMRPGVPPIRGTRTKLHEAARRGDLRVIASFASRREFINARDRKGLTPASNAIECGRTAAVRALVLLGAEFKLGDDLDGATLIQLAAESNQEQMIRVLDSLGADVKTRPA
jgi:hypothetical protein